MGKKSRKKKNLSINDTSLSSLNQDVTWDDLDKLRQETAESIISQQILTQTLINNIQPIIAKDPKLGKALTGLVKSYKDIAEVVAKNTEKHMTRDENNNFVSIKKGVVSTDSDDMIEYMSIVGEYIHAQEQVADLTFKGHTEIFTQIKNSGLDLGVEKEVEELNKVYAESKVQLATAISGSIDKISKNNKKGKKHGK